MNFPLIKRLKLNIFYFKKSYLITFFLLLSIAFFTAYLTKDDIQRIQIFHILDQYAARDGALTINITGSVTPSYESNANSVKYRLNEGQWSNLPQGGPRVLQPNFTIELPVKNLKPGRNCIHFNIPDVVTTQPNNQACFVYDSSLINHTSFIDWKIQPLDVQDGYWEILHRNNEFYVRPKPGHEGYDRILMVTGAFEGPRRIEGSLIYRNNIGDGKPYGFGILPLWGGHLDNDGVYPRRGWAYGLGWYYSHQGGIGVELATKYADKQVEQIYSYRTYQVEKNQIYYFVIEARPMLSDKVDEGYYQIQMKMWSKNEREPKNWQTIDNLAATKLPIQDYAVAILAHRAQVEFGSLTIKKLDYSQNN